MTLAPAFRRALLAAIAILPFASRAFAQGGINLSWSDCGSFGQAIRVFSCDSNIGQQVLVASAVPGVDLPQLVGMESEIIVATGLGDPALSAWWQLASGGCRPVAISTSFDFTSNGSSCLDPWNGQAQGAMLYEQNYGGANRARIRTICALSGTTAVDATDEYDLFHVTITNAKSTGSGACAGCGQMACLLLNSIKLDRPVGVGDVFLTAPLFRNFVIWQPVAGTCFGDPVRRTTWGSVKSLYR